MKKFKKLFMGTSIIWLPIVGSVIAEEWSSHTWIDFNWLGQVLPIPLIAILIFVAWKEINNEN